MRRDSKMSKILLRVYRDGYRVSKDGIPHNPLGKKLIGGVNSKGYHTISVKVGKKTCGLSVHCLQAYQKFGDSIFDDEIEVRHFNSDKLDNSWDNIGIGTHSENMMDAPSDARIKTAFKAASVRRRFSDSQIKEIRKRRVGGDSLKSIAKDFKTSKGHISEIINRKIYTNI